MWTVLFCVSSINERNSFSYTQRSLSKRVYRSHTFRSLDIPLKLEERYVVRSVSFRHHRNSLFQFNNVYLENGYIYMYDIHTNNVYLPQKQTKTC